MARVSTYLIFPGNTAEAFQFYRGVFQTDFLAPAMRYRDVPPQDGCPDMPPDSGDLIMHVALPILGGHVLMATDSPPSKTADGFDGKNFHINLEPDTREETDRLFRELSAGGQVEMPLQDMFWGAYYGSFTDKYGVHWMLNCAAK